MTMRAASEGAARGGPPEAWPAAWGDLLLYVIVGFGLFVVASVVLGSLFPQPTMALSLVVYGLNFLCFAGAVYWLGVRRPGRTWAEFGLRPFPRQWLWAALVLAAAFIPIRAAAALLTQWLLGDGLSQLQGRMEIVAPGGPVLLNLLLTVAGAGLLVPFAEELYFRGLIHRWFWARYPGRLWLRVGASSLLFALGHFDNPGVAASSFFLGALCALVFERTGSLWLPAAVHAANNSLAVSLVYLALVAQGGT
jgi:membrane protease YdiL (CAAX protease family)